MDQINQVIEALEEIAEDSETSKSVRECLNSAIEELKNGEDRKVSIHKALNILDDLSDNPSLESYSRGQIWSIVGLLESMSV